MSSFIPLEIQINILERLPVDTIVRFTAVCKSWNSIIKNPDGLKLSSTNNPRTLLMPLQLRNDVENRCVLLSQDSFAVEATLGLNFVSNDPFTFMRSMGTCHGLICLAVREEDYRCRKRLYVCNPAIKKLKQLPSSSTQDRLERSGVIVEHDIGFGFDEIANDYKVVKIYHIYETIRTDSIASEYEPIEMSKLGCKVEVYSLRNDSWKTVDANGLPPLRLRSVSLNNAIHWLTTAPHCGPIFAFDFTAEAFHEIALPVGSQYGHSQMVSYKGYLAILHIDDFAFLREDAALYNFSIWIMREYRVSDSWSKEFSTVYYDFFGYAINFTQNGKLIFCDDNDVLGTWDSENGQFRRLVGYSDQEYAVIADYSESLMLI